MMRIAIATDGDYVAAHFGKCPTFTLVDVEENKITAQEVIDNPGHQPGFIPRFLHEKGVRYIMTGSMGTRAKELLRELDMEAITGVEGKVVKSLDKVIKELETLRAQTKTVDTGGG
jgi:predicted Fe-Mo cluster-binding NifX family protein